MYIYIYIYIYLYIYKKYIHIYIYDVLNCLFIRGPFRTTNPRYESCSHFCETFRFWGVEKSIYGVDKCRTISLKYVPIYRNIHRIQIRYTKYQFIVHHTPTIPKYFRIFGICWNISKIKNNENTFLFY